MILAEILKYSMGSFKDMDLIYIANMKLFSGDITIDDDKGTSTFSIFSVTVIDVFYRVMTMLLMKLAVMTSISARESNPPVIVLY